MTNREVRRIQVLLTFLVVYDLALAITALGFPSLWFDLIHGSAYIDPQSLMPRTGAVWASFSLFQLVALTQWQVRPYWLTVVAGIRLTEIFSDWVYLFFAQDLTRFGELGLLVQVPMNVALGAYLIRSFVRFDEATRSA